MTLMNETPWITEKDFLTSTLTFSFLVVSVVIPVLATNPRSRLLAGPSAGKLEQEIRKVPATAPTASGVGEPADTDRCIQRVVSLTDEPGRETFSETGLDAVRPKPHVRMDDDINCLSGFDGMCRPLDFRLSCTER